MMQTDGIVITIWTVVADTSGNAFMMLLSAGDMTDDEVVCSTATKNKVSANILTVLFPYGQWDC